MVYYVVARSDRAQISEQEQVQMTLHDKIEQLSGSRVFLHDAFFAAALKYEGVLAEVIETITGRNLEVARVQVEETVDNRPYHSVRLDATCYEQNGTIWNVEIENWSGSELMRRMRFNGDVITARNFNPKRPYKARARPLRSDAQFTRAFRRRARGE